MSITTIYSISSLFSEDVIKELHNVTTNSIFNFNVGEYSVTEASKPGEGFIADIYRLKIKQKSKENSFIVKAMSKNKALRKAMRAPVCFEREIYFYVEILPELFAVQKFLGADNNFQDNVPRCFKVHCDGREDFIVLNDLSVENFVSPSLLNGLKKEEGYKAVEVLAKFHALSLALKKINPNKFSEIAKKSTNIYQNSSNRDWFAAYFKSTLAIMEKIVLSERGPNSDILKRFKAFVRGDFYGRLVDLLEADSKYSVICNGDAWAPNFLFSTNGVVLLDFQLARCGSPMSDLLYLLYSSLRHDVLSDQYITLLKFYYKTLTEYLNDMSISNEEVFPEKDFYLEVKKYASFGLGVSLFTILLSVQKYHDQKLDYNSYGDADIPLEDVFNVRYPQHKDDRLRLVNVLEFAIDNNII